MRCKSCGIAMSEASAGASIFALSFLPMGGRKRRSNDRSKKIKIAKQIGPLCWNCLHAAET